MSQSEVDELKKELEQLRQRNADLEARVAAELAAREAPSWLHRTLDSADIGIWDWDMTLDTVTWTEALYRINGRTRAEFDGSMKGVENKTLEEDRPVLAARIKHSLTTGEPYSIEYRVVRPDGEIRWLSGRGLTMFDEHGKPYRMAGTAVDVTDRKREEAETLAMQRQIIDAQREALRELGAPIIPLADRTLAVPLIGLLSRERAQQVNEVLLNAVRERGARVVLLDLTGVPSVDISAAQALVSSAHAVRLLGAQVVLTGIKPQVAQTLVALGVDMQTFVIKADLQSGIEYAADARRHGG
ncbi:MAG: PAS domain-containing protein [Byssovorax sp.]